METLEYSSNPESQLNTARVVHWANRYMLGRANIHSDTQSQSRWMGAINRSRNDLRAVAKRYRDRLNQRRIYKVPFVGETGGVSFYQVVTACSAANAQVKADKLVEGCFITGEPIDMGAA